MIDLQGIPTNCRFKNQSQYSISLQKTLKTVGSRLEQFCERHSEPIFDGLFSGLFHEMNNFIEDRKLKPYDFAFALMILKFVTALWLCSSNFLLAFRNHSPNSANPFCKPLSNPLCSTPGKPTRSFATERVSLDSV